MIKKTSTEKYFKEFIYYFHDINNISEQNLKNKIFGYSKLIGYKNQLPDDEKS